MDPRQSAPRRVSFSSYLVFPGDEYARHRRAPAVNSLSSVCIARSIGPERGLAMKGMSSDTSCSGGVWDANHF
jgi:hypothetical protein